MLTAGHVYLAPDNCHCSVLKTSTGYQIGFSRDEPIGNFRPAINALFRSVAKACPAHSIGIILSGMGSDGVEGLLAMRTQNCLTIAQDEQSSIVFGMPAIAIEKRAVTEILAADQIAGYLLTTVH